MFHSVLLRLYYSVPFSRLWIMNYFFSTNHNYSHFFGTMYINFLYAVLEYKQRLQSTTIKWSRVGYICYLIYSLFCINIESNQIQLFLLDLQVALEILKYNFTCLLYRTASTFYLVDWIKVEFIVLKIRRQGKMENERNHLCSSESTWRGKAQFL